MSSKSDGRDFEQRLTADPSDFIKGFDQAKQAAFQSTSAIDAQFKKMGDTVSLVNKTLLGFAAVVAGGGALKKFIGEANEWNGAAGKMASQLGITTQQASILNVAFNRLGIDSDVYLTASQRISASIQKNGQAFETLGVKVKDITGAYRPVTQVMTEVNDKLAAIKNPIEQNIAGQQIYGKGWAEIRSTLKLTTAALSESEVRARQLGLIVGPEGVAMSKQYSAQMRDLNLVAKGLEVQFGNALLPVFVKTGSWMAKEGPKMGEVFTAVLLTISAGAQTAWKMILMMGDTLGAAAAQAALLLKGDLKGANQIGLEWLEKQKASAKEVRQIWATAYDVPKPTMSADAPGSIAGPHYDFKKDAPDKSRMGQWESELAERKAALERGGLQEGQFRELSKSQELTYWQDLLKRKDLVEGEKIAITRRAAGVEMAQIRETFDVRVKVLQAEAEQYKNNTDERMRIEREIQAMYQVGTKEYEESQKRITAIQRQAAEQALAIAQSREVAKRDALMSTMALEEQTIRQAADLGVISQAQLLQAEESMERRRFEIASQAVRDRLKLMEADPDRNPVEVERVHREIERLEQEHQLRLGQLKGQLQQDSNKYLSASIDGVAGTFEGVIQRIGTQIKSLNDLFRASLNSLIQVGMQMLAKMAGDWLRQELAMRIFGKATAIGKIGEQSALAGAGGTASMAAAPFPLNLSAPAFGAAMSAAALAFAPMASASQGYDIPGTVNPIIQAHAREMVLPAKQADVIRDMADGGGGAPIHLHTQGGDFIHKDDLVPLLRSMKRNFVIT